ncbi:hypothetical protein KA107_02580 [Candidatus Pacearchaeota archaeon]|nr:hypothetical protein [Candidatus Pacearchaeota archaeon]
MSLFNKKDKIPEIPEAPEVPRFEFSSEKIEVAPATIPTMPPIPSLPSMPGDGRNQLNRDIIKSAIEDSSEKTSGDTSGAKVGSMKGFEESPLETGIPDLPSAKPETESKPQPLEFPSFDNKSETVPSPPKIKEMPKLEIEPTPTPNNIVKKDAEESIFVRIDKFNSAKRDVQEISRDLKEIEQVLTKLEQIKMQEDEEVAEIGKVMEEIKLKMNRIDSDIFNRI